MTHSNRTLRFGSALIAIARPFAYLRNDGGAFFVVPRPRLRDIDPVHDIVHLLSLHLDLHPLLQKQEPAIQEPSQQVLDNDEITITECGTRISNRSLFKRLLPSFWV